MYISFTSLSSSSSSFSSSVSERMNYKIALLCFKCLADEAPSYLTEYLKLYSPTRSLRSMSDRTLLEINNTNYKTFGERAFKFSGPKIWNTIPKQIREIQSIDIFKSRLKSFLFSRSFS